MQGCTFEGYRIADGSVGTGNLWVITTTVQCVAGVLDVAAARIRSELLPRYAHVDGVVGLEHSYGCGVAIDAPDAPISVRTLRHISLNPNSGGEVMVLSLCCEKLQPQRLMPPGSLPLMSHVRLQDEQYVGFMGMVDDVLATAEVHLKRLNARRRETVPTTGRGAPYGWAACPVIKVATRSEVAHRWHDLMDVSAGTIADVAASIEEVGWDLFRLTLDVASGRKRTWAEHWKLHNALVLFNPAPVT